MEVALFLFFFFDSNVFSILADGSLPAPPKKIS